MSTGVTPLRTYRRSIAFTPQSRVARGCYAVFTTAILLLFGSLGALAKTRFDLVLPGPVIGLLLIASALAIVELRFARLSAKLHAASAPTTRPLLTHMGLLFVPAGVGIITEFPELRHAGTALGVGVVASTFVGVAVTYATMRLLARPGKSAC